MVNNLNAEFVDDCFITGIALQSLTDKNLLAANPIEPRRGYDTSGFLSFNKQLDVHLDSRTCETPL
jgi:hypothetical protein